MWYAPYALLICDENKPIPVGEAIRGFEIVSIAFDVVRLAITVLISQQRQMPGLLLRNNDIIIGEDEQSAGCSNPVTNGVAVKPSITRGVCPAYGMSRDRLAATGSLFGGGRFSALMIKRLPNS
jgi:hypothetical protein